METETLKPPIDKYIQHIQAAYHNEDILVEASKRAKQNLFVATSLESIVLALKKPRFMFARYSMDVTDDCYLIAQTEALKALKMSRQLTIIQGSSGMPFSYNGELLNCFPALVDHMIRGGRPGSFPFLQDAFPDSYGDLGKAYREIEQFKHVYNTNAAPEHLAVFKKLNPFTPVNGYWSESSYFRKEVDKTLPSFPSPIAFDAEKATFAYSSETGSKTTDGATDNIGRNHTGMITLENARFVAHGVKSTISYQKPNRPTDRLRIPWLEMAYFDHHVTISGNASLKLSVYGTVKDDSPGVVL